MLALEKGQVCGGRGGHDRFIQNESKISIGIDPKVIHIDLEPTFCDHVSGDVIYKGLEGRRSIVKIKKHNCRFEGAKGGDESCFPLV